MFGIKSKIIKNILQEGNKIERPVAALLQLFDWYGLVDLQTCQSQDNTEEPLTGGSLRFFLQTNCEEQKQKSMQVAFSHYTNKNYNDCTFEKFSYFDPSVNVMDIIPLEK